jgi:putative ABC transport system permease protein
MFATNLRFFTRIFLKDKFFSLLNILSLALGIAVSILLLLILQNDLTYDKYHLNHANIYRLGGHLQATGIDVRLARSARELGRILNEEIPEVKGFVRANSWDRTLVTYESKDGKEKSFYEENIVRADSTYFTNFTHEFISGNPAKCLADLNTVVLTESLASKYFEGEDPIGKNLLIDGDAFSVTAIIKDVPENTHLKFDLMMSRLPDREWAMQNGELKSEAFWNPDVFTYLIFPDHYNVKDFYAKWDNIYVKYYKSFGDQVGGKYTPILEPLADIHFHSKLEGDEPQGNMAYLFAFTGIGVFIILLACINYMNLSTAKSVNRAAEIAMKKTLGSGKKALVVSFLGESVFLAFVSLLVALLIVALVIKGTSFSQLIGKNLSFDLFENKLLLMGSILITLLIGVISGLYPAFYLPSIPTIQALKGKFKNQRSAHTLRRILTTVQFAISIFVVVCTLLMKDQINFVRNMELGFDKDNILILPIQDTLVERQMNGIKSELMTNPAITGATTSHNIPGYNTGGTTVMWAESESGMKQQGFTIMFVGEDYLKTMNIRLTAGSDLPEGKSYELDSKFMVNEAGVKLMGWDKDLSDGAQDAIGKKVKFYHQEKDGQIVGVVKDFNFSSLHNPVEPLLIMKGREDGGFLHLKIAGQNIPETMKYIHQKWAKFDPNNPFEYFFLDQKFNEQYKADETQYSLLSVLAWVCIFISLLGLLGLSAFSANQRTKEIGVRKVHGASTPQIIYLLFKDVMFLVLISSVLVIPLVLLVVREWLGNFAFQGAISYGTFLLVGVLALVVTFLTVAFHSWKTARTNPVVSLKYE